MALTAPPSTLNVQHWARDVFSEAKIFSFFFNTGMVGKGTDAVIQERTELKKDVGDTIYITLVPDLDGSGVVNDDELEGNEEAMDFSRDTVTIGQLRNGLLLPGKYGRKIINFDIRSVGRDRLARWKGRRFDQIIFRHLAGVTTETYPATALAPTANRQIFGGARATEAAIDGTNDFMTTEEKKIKRETKS